MQFKDVFGGKCVVLTKSIFQDIPGHWYDRFFKLMYSLDNIIAQNKNMLKKLLPFVVFQLVRQAARYNPLVSQLLCHALPQS